MSDIPDYVKLQARIELARRDFYSYCRYKMPSQYTPERVYLKDMCNRIQAFIQQDEKKFLVLTVPPRHRKSLTATCLTEYLFGDDPSNKVMTGSYNETLSTTFATKVRDTILEIGESTPDRIIYRDIFPDTKVKYGEASKSYWALEGSTEKNYLATSPTGTATGIGARYIIIDDVIKNDKEAYNEMVKEGHWSWLTNTMMQRTEGDDYKFIIIMTRWATDDLAGRVISEYGDLVEHISYSAIQPDGSMLDPSTLNERNYKIKTKNMNPDIVDANYNQKPVDVKGKLYKGFQEYDEVPPGQRVKKNRTDTADKGTDFLCSINWEQEGDQVYVTDVYFSDEAMETTEPDAARMMYLGGVNEATVESNNGGRGWGRNVKRILKEKYSFTKTVFIELNQTQNKEARILSSSAWVQNNVHMPKGWKEMWPEFYKNVMNYQKKGKNTHDDGPDVLAGIYEEATNNTEVELGFF